MILIRKFCKALLQHFPDFKGIERFNAPLLGSDKALQHFPDFKGIESDSLATMGVNMLAALP